MAFMHNMIASYSSRKIEYKVLFLTDNMLN